MTIPYPWPDTVAAACLEFVQANPGCSQGAVVRHVGRSYVLVAKMLGQLEKHGLIEVVVNEYGHKSISACSTSEVSA